MKRFLTIFVTLCLILSIPLSSFALAEDTQDLTSNAMVQDETLLNEDADAELHLSGEVTGETQDEASAENSENDSNTEQEVASTVPTEHVKYIDKRCREVKCYETSKYTGERYLTNVYYYTDANGQVVKYILDEDGNISYDLSNICLFTEYDGCKVCFTEIKNGTKIVYIFDDDGNIIKTITENVTIEEIDPSKKSHSVEPTGNAKFDEFINNPKYTDGAKIKGWCSDYTDWFTEYCFPHKKYKYKKYTNLNNIQAGDQIVTDVHTYMVLKREGLLLYTAEGGISKYGAPENGCKYSAVGIGWTRYIKDSKTICDKFGNPETFECAYHYYPREEKTVVPKVTIRKITIPKKVNKTKCNINVKWGKLNTPDGFEIQYSKSKTFDSKNSTVWKKYKNNSPTTSIVLKGLYRKSSKHSGVYYIRVRSYKKINGENVYSKWSAMKEIQIKKRNNRTNW